MKKAVFIIVLVASVLMTDGFVYANKEVPYTLEDRDRLIRVEEGLKSVNHRIDSLDKRIDALDKRIDSLDKRIDGLDKRIDALQSIMLGGFGIIATGMIALVGFVLWDRRTALAPAVRKIKELEEELETALSKARELQEKEEKVEMALRKYAKKEPELSDILKEVGVL